jgi:hypothetical protein
MKSLLAQDNLEKPIQTTKSNNPIDKKKSSSLQTMLFYWKLNI